MNEAHDNSRIYARIYGHTFSQLRNNEYSSLEHLYDWVSSDKDAIEIFNLAPDAKFFWFGVRDAYNDYNDQLSKGKKPEYNKPVTKLFRLRYDISIQ